MKVTIDLSDIYFMEQLHDRLAAELDFPGWYGHNLDALHDMLTEVSAEITFVGTEEAGERLGTSFSRFLQVCEDADAENPNLRVSFSSGEEV